MKTTKNILDFFSKLTFLKILHIKKLLKKLIFTFIGFALLLSFHASTASASYYENSAIYDAASDLESSENENCELEDSKFLNHFSLNFFSFKFSSKFAINSDSSLQKNFLEVPTSPPNA